MVSGAGRQGRSDEVMEAGTLPPSFAKSQVNRYITKWRSSGSMCAKLKSFVRFCAAPKERNQEPPRCAFEIVCVDFAQSQCEGPRCAKWILILDFAKGGLVMAWWCRSGVAMWMAGRIEEGCGSRMRSEAKAVFSIWAASEQQPSE